jgi:Rrf2 family protein
LFVQLAAAGLVHSTRGAKGGFTLAKPPAQIRVSEIIQTLEGSIAPVECVDDPKICSRADICVTRDIWAEMKKAMGDVLESTTLADLVERQREKGESAATMYYI